METLPALGDVDRSSSASDRLRAIPDYLQPFIVEQDLSRYSAIDQAVWRFVLLQLTNRLEHTAHPSYVRGLAETAISTEHIPSIEEMNEALGSIGWRAVCVDGFIPPRAFQAFQALGVLPIAAEIRSVDHLPYTPAPDIIHEAAGHAPILIDPRYAAYVRAAGEVAARAFSSPADARVDRAVRALSALKEAPDPLPQDLASAQLELEQAVAAIGSPSEATRVARLYWWTAEYGLVGTPDNYRLYGAGLLSSLGESHFCHAPSVAKHRLSAQCTAVGYDITRPQPQLFVAEDFEHLHAVLADVSQTLAYEIGGSYAVRAALESSELCTVYLPGGAQIIGRMVAADGDDRGQLLRFAAGAAIAHRGRLLGYPTSSYVAVAGRLADGTDPRQLATDRARWESSPGRVELRYACGIRVSGRVGEGPWSLPDAALWLHDFRLELGDRPPITAPVHPLLLADRVVTAGAGSTCPDVSPLEGGGPAERITRPQVPKLRAKSPRVLELEHLYGLAASARRRSRTLGNGGETDALRQIHAKLEQDHPHDWLLRWNVLECLKELGAADSPLGRTLAVRLRELEEHYAGQHPIALGLEYLEGRS